MIYIKLNFIIIIITIIINNIIIIKYHNYMLELELKYMKLSKKAKAEAKAQWIQQ